MTKPMHGYRYNLAAVLWYRWVGLFDWFLYGSRDYIEVCCQILAVLRCVAKDKRIGEKGKGFSTYCCSIEHPRSRNYRNTVIERKAVWNSRASSRMLWYCRCSWSGVCFWVGGRRYWLVVVAGSCRNPLRLSISAVLYVIIDYKVHTGISGRKLMKKKWCASSVSPWRIHWGSYPHYLWRAFFVKGSPAHSWDSW